MRNKMLVTGGAGFIGSHILNKLLEMGCEVTIIDNLSTGYLENLPADAKFIEGDCSDSEVYQQLRGEKYDVIFHIAGQSSGEVSFEDPVYDLHCNTVSTLRLLDFARESRCPRIVYASTMSVYGNNGREKCSEEDQLTPISFYAIGKKASEEYLKVYAENYGIEYCALRYFNVYGPGQNMNNMKQGMVSIFLRQLMDPSFSNILVKGDRRRFRDFIYIDDVVKVTIQAGFDKNFTNLVLNVGTGVKTTVEELIGVMMKESGIYKEVIYEGSTPGDQFGIFADTQELSKVTDFQMTPLEEGMKKFVNSIVK